MSRITLIIIISLLVLWIFYNSQLTENYSDMNIIKNKNDNDDKNNTYIELDDNLIIPQGDKKHVIKMPPSKCISQQKKYYITKPEINDGHVESCPKDAESIQKFNTDFFNFRDKTEFNTSMEWSGVDKINDMLLDGSYWNAKKGEIRTVGEIFDDLTKGQVSSDCTRLPRFDSVMYDGYMPKQVTGLYSSGDEWTYKNEYIENGGEITDNLYAHETINDTHFPLSAFPYIKPTEWDGGDHSVTS